jgi:hypothetical protein
VTNEQNFRPQLTKIASAALDQTDKGAMAWRTTDDEDAFLFSGPKSSLIIASVTASNPLFPRARILELRVLNNRGTVVETLRASSDDNSSELLRLLYQAARRSALDVDGVLDTTLKDLQELKDEPHIGGFA